VADGEQQCPRCGDPGPPHTVTVPLNPDAPAWDVWTIELWQCRSCLHRYSRAAVASQRQRAVLAVAPPFAPTVRTVRAAECYL